MPSTILVAGNTIMNKTDTVTDIMKFIFKMSRQTINNSNHKYIFDCLFGFNNCNGAK